MVNNQRAKLLNCQIMIFCFIIFLENIVDKLCSFGSFEKGALIQIRNYLKVAFQEIYLYLVFKNI